MVSVIAVAKKHIYELDLLRGFFILVIILDHLQFYDSPMMYLTGEGRLWTSAAEGFFLISGLLIGYIRAYKDTEVPLWTLTKKLWLRALKLYLWGMGITFLVVGWTLLVGANAHPLLPNLPAPEYISSLPTFLFNVINGTYFSPWIYFLRLYAIMLFVTPAFLWFIRRKQYAVIIVISLACFALGMKIPEAGLQWQLLFFGAGLIGYKLEAINTWFNRRPRLKRASLISAIVVTFVTIIISFFFTLGWDIAEDSNNWIISWDAFINTKHLLDPYFSDSPMTIWRVLLSFVWFIGLLSFTHLFRKWIKKFFGWILIMFGMRSLSAYCLQALVLCLVVTFVPFNENNYWLNGLVGLGAIMIVWGLLKIPAVRRVLPV